jgi:Plasmid encoded RepA protein
MVLRLIDQLEIFGLEETRKQARGEGASQRERARLERRVEVAHDLMSGLPSVDDLSFLHSGLCQVALPHSRPSDNSAVWHRQSGRFSLMIQPGVIDVDGAPHYVGVPYGPKARLIMIHLQTEGLKSRTVNLGASFSAFMRSLGLAVTGGKRGTIGAVREQALRIAQCRFTMQWDEANSAGEGRAIIANTSIVDGLELWRAGGQEWAETVELSEKFHAHLREHAVPLDKRGIAHLSANSLGLDLYALFAYRLPRLERDVHLRWGALQAQIGSAERTTNTLAQRIREVMPDVMTAYPHANVEVTSHGLLLKPSRPAVPKAVIPGYRMVEGKGG